MKNLLGIILILLFVFSIIFTITNNINTTTSDVKPGYASIVPIPPPEDPGPRKGC